MSRKQTKENDVSTDKELLDEAIAVIQRLKSANDLFEKPDYQHDPDTEWESAWEAADALLAKVKGGEPR